MDGSCTHYLPVKVGISPLYLLGGEDPINVCLHRDIEFNRYMQLLVGFGRSNSTMISFHLHHRYV